MVNTLPTGCSSSSASVRPSAGHDATVEQYREAEDRDRAPIGERSAQAGTQRRQRAHVVKYHQCRREPQREQRGQRAGEAEQHRELQPAAAQHLLARLLAPGEPGDQRTIIDHRGRGDRQGHADKENNAERQQCPEVAAKPAEQVREPRLAAALLPPRRGEKANREHRLQYARGELAQRGPGPELGEAHDAVIHPDQQQPAQWRGAEHRIGAAQPEHPAARIVAHEGNHRGRRRGAASEVGKPGFAGDVVTQNPLERGGIVRVRQLALARQVKIVQPRQPEAQRRGAQQRPPKGALLEDERPHRGIGSDQRAHTLRLEHRPAAAPCGAHQSLTVIARS